jgi:hypothetical protein
MSECLHRKAHFVFANVFNIEDTQRFMADIRIACADCGMPFKFIGLPDNVINTTTPQMSMPFNDEARLPIEPMDMDGPVRPDLLEYMKSKMNKPA